MPGRGNRPTSFEVWRAALETITTTLTLLAGVVASSAIQRTARLQAPLALVQIATGAAMAALLGFHVSLPPEVFLLLFVAPLLFLDAWRISKAGLLRDKWTIGALALGLVVFTVLAAGLFIHYLLPAVPTPIAFALAAALSPTDAVAFSAVAERFPISPRLLHILEGEALLNDASGLVCLKFSIAAALTGGFSLVGAGETLTWLVLGGAAAGIAVAMLANAIKDWIAQHFGEESGAQILVSLLLPFGAYMAADRLGASGILAAVAAGIVMSAEELAGRALAVTRIRREAVWDAVQFAGNGAVFVLLGQALVGIIAGAGQAIAAAGRQNPLWLLVYVIAITASLVTLRAVWVFVTLRLFPPRGLRGEAGSPPLGWKLVALASLAGMRGAVTLSGVMTLPLLLVHGAAFPTRDLIILLAAGVIVLSVIVANAGLPLLLSGTTISDTLLGGQEENAARIAAAEAAIAAMEQVAGDAMRWQRDAPLYKATSARIAENYRTEIALRTENGPDGTVVRAQTIDKTLQRVALHAERDALYRLGHAGALSEELTRALVREVDLQESRLNAG